MTIRPITDEELEQTIEREYESCQQQNNALLQSEVTSSDDAKHNSRPRSQTSNARTHSETSNEPLRVRYVPMHHPPSTKSAQQAVQTAPGALHRPIPASEVEKARQLRREAILRKRRVAEREQAKQAAARARNRNEILQRKLAEQRRLDAKHSEEMKAKQAKRRKLAERRQQEAIERRRQEKANREAAVQAAKSRTMSTLRERQSQLPVPTPIASRSGIPAGRSAATDASGSSTSGRWPKHKWQQSSTAQSTSSKISTPATPRKSRNRDATRNEQSVAAEGTQATEQEQGFQQESSPAAPVARRRVTPRSKATKGKFLMPRDITLVWQAMAENA